MTLKWTSLLLRARIRELEPNVQQNPHAGRATAYVQQEQNSFDTSNDVMVNDIREEWDLLNSIILLPAG